MGEGPFPWATFVADTLGLGASVVLLIPAFRKSRAARLAALVAASTSRSRDVQELRRAWQETSEAWKAGWDARDFSYLFGGLILLLASFAIKVIGLLWG